jgi:hypothetical protein
MAALTQRVSRAVATASRLPGLGKWKMRLHVAQRIASAGTIQHHDAGPDIGGDERPTPDDASIGV